MRFASGCTCQNGATIGAYTFMGTTYINSQATIGRACSIARDVTIGALPHPDTWLSTSSFQYDPQKFGFYDNQDKPLLKRTSDNDPSKRTAPVIGNDVWIGTSAIILNNVKIGDGAIIGAGALVSKDVAPYAVVAGVPARVIKYRFPSRTISDLLELKWWNYDVFHHELPFNEVERAIEDIQQMIADGRLQEFRPKTLFVKRVTEGYRLKIPE